MIRQLVVSVTLFALLIPAAAFAQVCVELDLEQDNLAESDRAGALILLRQEFEEQGRTVVDEGCIATYLVHHVQLGNSVNVTLRGPEGQRRLTAEIIEELPAVYSQIVYGLLNEVDPGTMASTSRDNVTMAQDAPRRVQSDNMFYLRLGGGSVWGRGFAGGPAFGLGWRYELNHIGIDASLLNLVVPNEADGVNGSWARIAVYYFLDGIESSSPYFGGGLSWGSTALCDDVAVEDDVVCFSGSGLQAELTAGYELLRAATIRLFFEANAVLPFYMADQEVLGVSFGEGDVYPVTTTLSIGLGFGKRNRGYR